jgi:hypothetical protein
MPETSVQVEKFVDIIPVVGPALSAVSDMPVIETKPDSQNAAPETQEAEKPAVVESKTTEESAAPEQPEQETAASDEVEPKKPAKGVQKRLDELVKQREDANRRAEQLQEMLAKALSGQQQQPPAQQQQAETDPEPQRPQRQQFGEDQNAFDEALMQYADQKAEWSAKRAVQATMAEERQRQQAYAQSQAQAAAQAAYKARVDKIVEEIPDYRSVAESRDVTVSMPMAQVIIASENGPKIQYYLGKNPAEAKRISALHPVLQLVEMGKIEAQVTAPAMQPVVKPVAVSAAPKPIRPLATSGSQESKTPETESMDEYASRRKKELAAQRRPGMR